MRYLMTLSMIVAFAAGASAQPAASTPTAGTQNATASKSPLVEFEMMTWPEVKAALGAGKTTALVYTGGTEQRGPQNVNGGHTLMGREVVKAIALRLGNAIAMPVLAYTPNNASADLPGTIGLTPELLAAILERIIDQSMVTGFKNVVIMGDHGGGQPDTYATVAKKMDAKFAAEGKHVYYCDRAYAPAQDDFYVWLDKQGYPPGSHAAIPDTSTMIYLGQDKGWVRMNLMATAVGDPVARPGEPALKRDPNAPRVNNGISGDARRSSAELGKMMFDQRVDYAVKQIQQFIPATASQQ
jgi:creatinine amidohydrolase/Fe(II)-dependent formamide hydrolase-like protein